MADRPESARINPQQRINGMYCDYDSIDALVALLKLKYGSDSQELKDRLNGLLAEPVEQKGEDDE
jgi:hypothetical protein